jgi:hypothetical protein
MAPAAGDDQVLLVGRAIRLPAAERSSLRAAARLANESTSNA